MLALLKTIEDCAEQAQARPELDLGLSPEDRAAFHELSERIESDVARPFFAIPADALERVDENWSKWIEWFRPLVAEMRLRVIPLLADPRRVATVLTLLGEGLGDATGVLGQLSPELAQTFQASVASGLESDRAVIAHFARGGTAPAANGQLEVWKRREAASIGFGLALFLIMEALERTPDDRPRLRLLVLKLKRMAAVSWVATRQLLA